MWRLPRAGTRARRPREAPARPRGPHRAARGPHRHAIEPASGPLRGRRARPGTTREASQGPPTTSARRPESRDRAPSPHSIQHRPSQPFTGPLGTPSRPESAQSRKKDRPPPSFSETTRPSEGKPPLQNGTRSYAPAKKTHNTRETPNHAKGTVGMMFNNELAHSVFMTCADGYR